MTLRGADTRRFLTLSGSLLLLGVSCAWADPPASADSQISAPGNGAQSAVERGQYLAVAGNCVSCHTRTNGAPLAGGVGFATPFGTIYSTNITPDDQTGIGKWSAEDLRRALHQGIRRDGQSLFPAFPYTSFTRISDEDTSALYTYLRTVNPVRFLSPANGLLFGQRWAMKIWNWLFFEPGRYRPQSSKSEEWNRGGYLVEGLGHCSACHTPRNVFMAERADEAFTGGSFRDAVSDGKQRRWSGVNLTSATEGIAAWSVADLAKYLHSGFAPRAGIFGPMNAVLVNSLSQMNAEDVQAIAVYLKALPPRHSVATVITADQVKTGALVYKARCEKCHGASGRGGMFTGPPLVGSAVVQSDDPATLINLVLYGPSIPQGMSFGGWESMKAYLDVLSDAEVAAVSNYVRASWNNRAGPVSTAEVSQQR